MNAAQTGGFSGKVSHGVFLPTEATHDADSYNQHLAVL
jgi:hypothetical protein